MPILVGLISGTLFGVGLAVSDMINPAVVIGFLNVTGAWDPSLAFTMIGALLVTIPTFAIARRMRTPIAATNFNWPSRSDIDSRLMIGAVVFGLGWGLSGFCPGPALASLSLGNVESFVFVLGLITGTLVARIALLESTVNDSIAAEVR